ncbi:MAG: CDP-alcohol phosphatidyltransferase family protein [Alphaproteobacteria bacterium]|nr:CDP-alcohol phosphatidyltransferase family protein [Alphaproteobacteria bacterium]
MAVLTLPNLVTLVRPVLAVPTALAILTDRPLLAAGLFALAVASDLSDGVLARRLGQVSVFGGVFDHASDCFYVTATLIALAIGGEVPAVLPPLVVAAFLQYTIDSRAHRGRALRASRLGRWNGILYFVLAGVPIVREAAGLAVPAAGLVAIAGWALVLSTLASMLDRATARPVAP